MAKRTPKTRAAVETFALFRPESAVVIALTLVLTSLKFLGASWIPGQWWMWLVAGIVAETALITSTLRDQQTADTIEDDLFLDELDLNSLKSASLKAKVNKAMEYHLLILREVNTGRVELTATLHDVIERLDDWILKIYQLARKIDEYRHDPILQRDLKAAPKELGNLRAQQQRRNSSDLAKAIASKEKQIQALADVNRSLEAAEHRIDTTLAAMGTAYTKIMSLSAQSSSQDDSKELQADIFEQIDMLDKVSEDMRSPVLEPS